MKQYNKILEAIDRGIQLALDDYDDAISSKKLGGYKELSTTKDYLDLMEYVVDLGLPSKTLWCKYNLGCNYNLLNNHLENSKANNWYGEYYAWGEIEPKEKYNWTTYKHCKGNYDKLTKYCINGFESWGAIDNLSVLKSEDDAAFQNMHVDNFKFHIPSSKQIEELKKYTTYGPVFNYKNINDLDGVIFKSKNGNEIFFPAGGEYNEKGFKYKKIAGNYWSSNLDTDWVAYAEQLNFSMNGENTIVYDIVTNNRIFGYNIRPVINL